MADVLTHVLVGYIIGQLLAFRYDWMEPHHVTLVMIGALSPDFVKINLVVPDELVQAVLGIPFSWSPLHTLGGTLLVVCLGSLLFAPEYRRHAIALFLLGALSHHLLDLALLNTSGYSYAMFWPLTEYRLPSGDLYRSSDPWSALVAAVGAALVWSSNRRRC